MEAVSGKGSVSKLYKLISQTTDNYYATIKAEVGNFYKK